MKPWQEGERDPDDDRRYAAADLCTERLERVEFVLGEMIACTWAPGDQRRFAHVWKLRPRQMGHITADAARIYREQMDPEAMRAQMTAGIDYLIEKAFNAKMYDFKTGAVIEQPDLKQALEGYRLQAHLNGILTDKHEISGPNGGPLTAVTADIRRMSPAELEAAILAKAAQIMAKELPNAREDENVSARLLGVPGGRDEGEPGGEQEAPGGPGAVREGTPPEAGDDGR